MKPEIRAFFIAPGPGQGPSATRLIGQNGRTKGSKVAKVAASRSKSRYPIRDGMIISIIINPLKSNYEMPSHWSE